MIIEEEKLPSSRFRAKSEYSEASGAIEFVDKTDIKMRRIKAIIIMIITYRGTPTRVSELVSSRTYLLNTPMITTALFRSNIKNTSEKFCIPR